MQAQEAAETQAADPATAVVMRMRYLGVPGFPRNYELFYEAVANPRGPIATAIAALGGRPKQQDLDRIAGENRMGDTAAKVDEGFETISTKLNEILSLLRKERVSMETYGQILGETSSGLNNRSALSREFLEKIVSVMATATRTSIDNRNQLVSTMQCKTSELNEVRSKLEEYKKLADTDALTQLHNRRAFDRAISKIYDTPKGVAFGALILADIDRFKPVNDRYGHPVGDRILQIIAGIIRSTCRDGAFVARTGGEEFAIVLEGYGEDSSAALADQIRQAVADASFLNVAKGVNYGPITISLGTCMATQAQGPDDLYTKADRALYAAKAAGRDRVMRFSSLAQGNMVKNWLLYRKE